MTNQNNLQNRLLSGAIAALTVSILVVFASLTHTVAALATHV